MKLIGFIKEYNNLDEGIALDTLLDSKATAINDTEKVLDYLNQGILLLGWMGYFIDVRTKELIAPDSYFTDGVWVWPSYFPYYLKKYPSMQVDKEFITYLNAKSFDFKIDIDFDQNRNAYESALSSRLNSI